jgi:endoribonuclease Dicer
MLIIYTQIPVDVAFMTMLFPSILHRIDSALITLDACKLLDLDIEPPLALEAMTKDSDNTEDHGSKQINFQTGMGENYERLEFLGDTFLKMATTISIFTAKPDQDEFFYHVERMLLLCNRNLFNHAVDRGLQEYIRSTSFDRRSWYPNLKLLHGKGTKHEFRHNLADKSIADVCEALIGASYLSGQDGNMDMGVKAVTKMVKSKNHTMTAFKDYYANYEVPDWQFPQQVSAEYSFQAKEVGEKIGYEFRSSTLVRSASKHPSWTYDRNIPNYQQLEFLGDALLDMTIVDYLYRQFPDANPQWLTEHKMDMVSNHFLGFLCVRLGLQRHLLCTTPSLLGQISSYVQELEKAGQAMKQSEAGDSETQGAYWLGVSSAPKALPDLVEAIIGAMFVDSEYDFGVVRRFTEQHIFPFFRDMAKYDTLASTNPITVLEHRLRNEMHCNDFALLCELVPCGVDEGIRAITESEVVGMMLIHKKPISNASALNGTSAKLSVAKTILGMIGGLTQAEYRERFGCNCNLRQAKK